MTPPVATADITTRMEIVKSHLQCPKCAAAQGGKAKRRKWQRSVTGTLTHRCYECDTCECEWVVAIRIDRRDGVLYTSIRLIEVRQ